MQTAEILSLEMVEGFKKYLLAFPEGLHTLQANFYLAQLHVKEGSNIEAIPNYEYVIDQPQSEFSEQALVESGLFYLDEKKKYMLKDLEEG